MTTRCNISIRDMCESVLMLKRRKREKEEEAFSLNNGCQPRVYATMLLYTKMPDVDTLLGTKPVHSFIYIPLSRYLCIYARLSVTVLCRNIDKYKATRGDAAFAHVTTWLSGNYGADLSLSFFLFVYIETRGDLYVHISCRRRCTVDS